MLCDFYRLPKKGTIHPCVNRGKKITSSSMLLFFSAGDYVIFFPHEKKGMQSASRWHKD
jgi:hypothetical protein